MAAQRKYPAELRERATRLCLEARRDPETRQGAYRRIAEQLGVHPEALRTWVHRAETDEGLRPGTTSDDAARLKELEREVRELRRANQILKSSAAFFAAEFDAHPDDREARLHRRSQARVRSRTDHPGVAGHPRPDRSIKLLRRQETATLGTHAA
ncbi:transposase [Leucobacter sp. CSA1]|uniref:Transposase n=1 Tax=Leucobacter chromiisoli TaxID=2796471 RepID=A0A934Q8T6_9MICO|nr:transposase [Leucobacter chromiisoli]